MKISSKLSDNIVQKVLFSRILDDFCIILDDSGIMLHRSLVILQQISKT